MAEDLRNLAEAFARKEETQKFLSNLEKLKADGSITPDVYPAMKAEYEQRLQESLQDIDCIKSQFRKQLETVQRECDIYRHELTKMEARYKAGELSSGTYKNSERSFRANIDQLERQSREFSNYLTAASSADVRILTKALPATTPDIPAVTAPAPPATAPEVSAVPAATSAIPPAQPQARPSKRKWPAIVAGIIVLLIIVAFSVFFLTPRNGESVSASSITIPVDIRSASNIGSLHLELNYDATMLNPVKIDGGPLLGNALFKYNSTVPGKIVVGMVSSSGMKGDGSLVLITFQVIGKSQATVSLSLANVVAYDSSSLTRLSLSTLNGTFAAKDGTFTPPILTFSPTSK